MTIVEGIAVGGFVFSLFSFHYYSWSVERAELVERDRSLLTAAFSYILPSAVFLNLKKKKRLCRGKSDDFLVCFVVWVVCALMDRL